MKHAVRCLLCTLIMLGAAASVRAQNAGDTTAPEPLAGMAAPSGPQAQNSAAGALRTPQYVDLLAGLGYTSDAFLTPNHPVADGIALAGLGMDYIHQGPELDLDALGDVERLEYFKNSSLSTFYGEFNGSAIWGHPTELFQWLLSDSFGEGMLNPLLAPIPQYLQTVNYATTGPYLNFNFGTSERLTLFGLYSRTTFERSPLDSQGYEGGAAFRHAFSSLSSFSLQATDQRIDFLDSAVAQSFPGAAHGYDIQAAWANYAATFGRTDFSASGGYNTEDYGGKQRGTPLANLRLSRQVSPFSTLFFEGSTGYSTPGSSLASPSSTLAAAGAQSIVETGTGVLAGTAEAAPFDRSSVSLGWRFGGSRTTLALIGTGSAEHYVQQSTFDETSAMASVSARRELAPMLSVQLVWAQVYAHYSHIDADTRTNTAQLSLSRQFRKATLSAYAQWLHQRSTAETSTTPVSSFDDERVGLELSYDLIGHRAPGQGPMPGGQL